MSEHVSLHPVRPAVPLILLGVLKGYVRNPVLLLIRTLFNMRTIKKRLPRGLPADLIALAALVASLYEILKTKMDQKRALAVVSACIMPAGLATQLANFRFVEEPRSFANLIANQQRTNREGPTRLNTMEILQADNGTYEFRVHRCLFMEAFSGLGIPELTRAICAVDNAIFNAYLPEQILFHRNGVGHRIADHAPFCEFHCEHLV